MNIIQYEHKYTDGAKALVYVQDELKGKHREHCLCHQHCIRFRPGCSNHCEIALALYAVCVKFSVTTPVYECPLYEDERLA